MQNKTKKFIEKAICVHSKKYDYSKTIYVNNRTKVCIICPKHGEFWQEPRHHLSNHGCPICGKESGNNKQRFTLTDFIIKSNDVHKGKYDYTKSTYINFNTKLCIICPKHGEFWQTPHSHLSGKGCPFCGKERNVESIKMAQNKFIEKSKEIHGDRYDYSKVEYVNSQTKVCIICPEHGEFWQTPSSHIQGHGCSKCGNINKANDKVSFLKTCNSIHYGKYDYSCVNYVNNQTKICIICPEHGEFWQRPDNHIKGQGCPKCNSSHMENEIRNLLSLNGISFNEQKKFDWLGKQSLDFYLPNINIAIECQGIQHFEPIGYFGSYEAFKLIQEHDQTKKQLCKENGVEMLYYANYDYDFPYEVISDKNELIKKIIMLYEKEN